MGQDLENKVADTEDDVGLAYSGWMVYVFLTNSGSTRMRPAFSRMPNKVILPLGGGNIGRLQASQYLTVGIIAQEVQSGASRFCSNAARRPTLRRSANQVVAHMRRKSFTPPLVPRRYSRLWSTR